MATPDLNNLVALLTVARERSFTRAAVVLGVSQSSLSRTVTALETELGMLLLIRTTRSVSTTEAGQRLLDSIAPKLEEIEAELAAVAELRERPLGTVRISATDYAANQYVWPKLQGLLREHQELRIDQSIRLGVDSQITHSRLLKLKHTNPSTRLSGRLGSDQPRGQHSYLHRGP